MINSVIGRLLAGPPDRFNLGACDQKPTEKKEQNINMFRKSPKKKLHWAGAWAAFGMMAMAMKLPAGTVKIAYEMRTPLERAAPTELKFWINGKEAASGTVGRTVPLTFTAAETFDVGRDTCSPVADDYFHEAPFAFEGTLKRLYFKNLLDEKPAFKRSPDDD